MTHSVVVVFISPAPRLQSPKARASKLAEAELGGKVGVYRLVLSGDVGFDELAIDVELKLREPTVLLRHRHHNIAPLSVIEFPALGDQPLRILRRT